MTDQTPTLEFLVETAKEYERMAGILVRLTESMKRSGTPESAIVTLFEAKRKADILGRSIYAVLRKEKADLVMDDAVNEIARMGLSPYRVSNLSLPLEHPKVTPFTPRTQSNKKPRKKGN